MSFSVNKCTTMVNKPLNFLKYYSCKDPLSVFISCKFVSFSFFNPGSSILLSVKFILLTGILLCKKIFWELLLFFINISF